MEINMAVSTSTTTIVSGASVKKNTGTVLGAGNTTTNNAAGYRQINNLPMSTNNLNPDRLQGLVIASNYNGVGFILAGTVVTITSITQSGSTGYTAITKSSHGLVVGDFIQVYGSDVPGYNVIHRVMVVTSSSVVKTDIRYSANTSTHGSYYKVSGNFNKMVRQNYIASIIGATVAGSANSTLVITGNKFVESYNASNGTYGTSITGFDYFTGVKTTGSTWGVLNKFHDIAANNENLTTEPHPTRAIPGRLVFKSYALIPVADSYNPKT